MRNDPFKIAAKNSTVIHVRVKSADTVQIRAALAGARRGTATSRAQLLSPLFFRIECLSLLLKGRKDPSSLSSAEYEEGGDALLLTLHSASLPSAVLKPMDTLKRPHEDEGFEVHGGDDGAAHEAKRPRLAEAGGADATGYDSNDEREAEDRARQEIVEASGPRIEGVRKFFIHGCTREDMWSPKRGQPGAVREHSICLSRVFLVTNFTPSSNFFATMPDGAPVEGAATAPLKARLRFQAIFDFPAWATDYIINHAAIHDDGLPRLATAAEVKELLACSHRMLWAAQCQLVTAMYRDKHMGVDGTPAEIDAFMASIGEKNLTVHVGSTEKIPHLRAKARELTFDWDKARLAAGKQKMGEYYEEAQMKGYTACQAELDAIVESLIPRYAGATPMDVYKGELDPSVLASVQWAVRGKNDTMDTYFAILKIFTAADALRYVYNRDSFSRQVRKWAFIREGVLPVKSIWDMTGQLVYNTLELPRVLADRVYGEGQWLPCTFKRQALYTAVIKLSAYDQAEHVGVKADLIKAMHLGDLPYSAEAARDLGVCVADF